MELVGYVRVSTAGQVMDGFGLDIQRQGILNWAQQHGHTIASIFEDEGVSGSEEMRDGLAEALGAIRFNGAEGIVVHSLDRLARSLWVQEAALQQAWNDGGRVFAVDSGEVLADSPDDPIRTFLRQILGAVSELEAGMIRRRLRRGRLHKASRGGYSYGAPPYGFEARDGELVANTSEQKIIAEIRRMRSEGRSYRDIANDLNVREIPSKRGGRWYAQTVSRVSNGGPKHPSTD